VLGRPSAQGHRPNDSAAQLALRAKRPSGPVRVAQPLGLVAHNRGIGEPLHMAAPAGCQRVDGAAGTGRGSISRPEGGGLD
jgi:hypothetical protein